MFEEQALKDIKETEKPPMISKLGKEFGMSLILSNVPKSPKFINGSFAAMFDDNQVNVYHVICFVYWFPAHTDMTVDMAGDRCI